MDGNSNEALLGDSNGLDELTGDPTAINDVSGSAAALSSAPLSSMFSGLSLPTIPTWVWIIGGVVLILKVVK